MVQGGFCLSAYVHAATEPTNTASVHSSRLGLGAHSVSQDNPVFLNGWWNSAIGQSQGACKAFVSAELLYVLPERVSSVPQKQRALGSLPLQRRQHGTERATLLPPSFRARLSSLPSLLFSLFLLHFPSSLALFTCRHAFRSLLWKRRDWVGEHLTFPGAVKLHLINVWGLKALH